ncbi:MAG: DUF4388 domain-containing protein [Chitinivibrionales bacterium]|nr:DUF4388 domain-containing protein [Chitinivibrionales bacterium]
MTERSCISVLLYCLFFFFMTTIVFADSTQVEPQSDEAVNPESLKIQKLFKSLPQKQIENASDAAAKEQKFAPFRTDRLQRGGSHKYVQVKNGPARVLETLDPNSPLLGVALKNSSYPLINYGEVWCLILYKGKEGWIEIENVVIVDKPTNIFIFNQFMLMIGVIGFIIAALSITLYLINRKKNEPYRLLATVQTRKKILFLSTQQTLIQRYLTDEMAPIENFFEGMGFHIAQATDGKMAHQLLQEFIPDSLIVDWQSGKNIQSFIEQVITNKSLLVVFYNVPDPHRVIKSTILTNVHYLGTSISDRDLIKVVSPHIVNDDASGLSPRKSIENSALQGDIGDGSLVEIIQFIEIGRKTGCLAVQDEKPSGLIYFDNGVIIYAASRSSVAENAVYDILSLKKGRFIFILGKMPKSSNCNLPTLPLLMEWSKVSDETSRYRLR